MLWEIFVAFLRGNRFVILDIPLLVESKIWAKFLRHLVVVNCSPSVQLSRLMERNNYSMEEAKIRVDSQFPLSEKCKLATKIIHNDGSIENTKKQAQDFYEELEKSWSLNLYEIGFLTVSISFVFIKLAVAYL
uniref:Dephospho-CoA kinase n=1 Tax=Ciona savignyi TaxID=51511 RepID=H2YV93_CIOSA